MGKFEMKKGTKGFRFNLKAGNGEIIASSETYPTEAACIFKIRETIESCRSAHIEDQCITGFMAMPCPKFEIYVDRAGEFRFRLLSKQKEILCVSEGYRQKASCQNGIKSVLKNISSPTIFPQKEFPAD